MTKLLHKVLLLIGLSLCLHEVFGRRSICLREHVEQVDISVGTLIGVRHREQPWMNYPNIKIYRNIQLEANIQTALSRHVQGLNISAEELFNRLRSKNCYSFIWGGAVRDAITGAHPFDIDIGTTCEPERIKEVCQELFGYHNCHSPHPLSQKLSIGRANKNTKQLEPIDVASWNCSFRVDQTKFEYTADSMGYFLGNGWTDNFLIDPTGQGLGDACDKLIRLPVGVSQREEWMSESFPTKLLRFWKLRTKGFHPADSETLKFVTESVREQVTEKQLKHFYCQHIRSGVYRNHTCLFETGTQKFTQRFLELFQKDFGAEMTKAFENKSDL